MLALRVCDNIQGDLIQHLRRLPYIQFLTKATDSRRVSHQIYVSVVRLRQWNESDVGIEENRGLRWNSNERNVAAQSVDVKVRMSHVAVAEEWTARKDWLGISVNESKRDLDLKGREGHAVGGLEEEFESL